MLTWAERLVLWNQFEILKALTPKDAKFYEEKQYIVEHGYEQFYGELHSGIDRQSVSSEVSSEVIEILDMFRAIHFSSERNKYTPKSENAKFEGFDGNNDHPQYGVAHFLRMVQGKWAELKDRPENSHSVGSLPRYRRMLEKWLAMGNERYRLTPEQIEAVCE